jgi:hypothetical protein
MLFRLKRVLKAKATIRTRTNANTHMNNMSTTLRQEAPSTIRATLKHLHGRLSIEDTTNNMVSHQRIRLQLRCRDFPFQLKLLLSNFKGDIEDGVATAGAGVDRDETSDRKITKTDHFCAVNCKLVHAKTFL